MKVFDDSGKLIAIFQKHSEILDNKNFLTDNFQEFQFGTFFLKAGEEIKRHIHKSQERLIFGTPEAIVVLEGSLEIHLYDNDKSYIKKIKLVSKDSILILGGGHSIKILKDCKFIEFKQGPYSAVEDKEHF